MFTITALIGNSNWSLTYKLPHDADKAYKALTAKIGTIELEDDYGCKISISADIPVLAVQRADVDKTFEGQCLMGLFQARAQGKLQAMAARDPQLMFLNSTPPVVANGIIRPAS